MRTFDSYYDSEGNYHSVTYEDGVLVSDVITWTNVDGGSSSGSSSSGRTSAYDSTANDTTRGGNSNFSSKAVLSGTSANDSLNNFANIVTVYGGGGDDLIYNGWFGSNSILQGESDNDSIFSYASDSLLKGGNGNDYLYSGEGGSTLIAGSGDDNILVEKYSNSTSDSYTLIDAGKGNDNINLYSIKSSTILAGGGNDTITDTGHSNRIFGGDGDDYIKGGGSKNTSAETIVGGKGADTIEIINGTSGDAKIYYADGDGNDIITDGFSFLSFQDDFSNPKNTIYITGGASYSTMTSGSDIVVSVGNGSITLKNSATYAGYFYHSYLNIDTLSSLIDIPNVDDVDDDNSGMENSAYTYSGGNQIISDYSQGKQINLATDFQGIGLNGNSFYVTSSSGSLEIQNARDKVISYGDASGNLIAYSYLASGGGEIDGRNISQFEIIIGGDHVDNQIYAGNGGSSLWGGGGGSDTLTGGDGYDEFFYALGSGDDVIKNANRNDLVNLLGVSLSQITDAAISLGEINISFSDGGHLKLESYAPTGFKVEGVTYAADRINKTWYTK